MSNLQLNNNSLCGIYLDKTVIDKTNMSFFKEFLYRKTYKNYKMTHVVKDLERKSDITDEQYKMELKNEMKKINPLEKNSNILINIDNKYKGVILVVPLYLINGPLKLDLTNVKTPSDADKKIKSATKIKSAIKIKNFFNNQLFGFVYVIKDLRRDVICLYEFYINDRILKLPFPNNRTPYKSDIIASKFTILNPINIKYTVETPSPIKEISSLDISFEDSSILSDVNINNYSIWSSYIIETIINSFIIDPFDINIWFGIDINTSLKGEYWSDMLTKIFIEHGFENPYFSMIDPMNISYDYNFVALTRKNQLKITSKKDINNVYNRLLYLYDQNINKCLNLDDYFEVGQKVYYYLGTIVTGNIDFWKTGIINKIDSSVYYIKDDIDNREYIITSVDLLKPYCVCNAEFKFDKKTILWLLRLPFGTTTVNINDITNTFDVSQKEFSGSFLLKNIKCHDKLIIGNNYMFKDPQSGELSDNFILESLSDKYASLKKIQFNPKTNKNETIYKIVNINNIILNENCSYNSQNYLWKLTLDKKSLTSKGKKFEDLDIQIKNIKNTLTTSNASILNNIVNKINNIDIKNLNIFTLNEIQKDYNNMNQTLLTNISNFIKEIEKSKFNYIVSGEEDCVTLSEGIANFHTHPYEQYIKYNCTIGIPSGPDFSAFLYSYHNFLTIFHTVITVEGIYIISFKKEFLEKYNTKILIPIYDRLSASYEFSKFKFDTPEEFCKYINEMIYNDQKFTKWHNSLISQQNKLFINYDIGSEIYYFDDKQDIRIGVINNKIFPETFNILVDGISFDVTKTRIDQQNKFYYDSIINKTINGIIEVKDNLKDLDLKIFECQFKSWEELVEYPNFNTFNINYLQKYNQCFLDHETIKLISKLYTYENDFFYKHKFIKNTFTSLFDEI